VRFGDTLTSGFGLTDLLGLPSLTEAAHNWTGSNQSVNTCSGFYTAAEVGAYAWAVAFNALGYARGHDFAFRGGKLRFAQWGNRTGHPTGRFPHYHRAKPHPHEQGPKGTLGARAEQRSTSAVGRQSVRHELLGQVLK
jgi:hypothetical protein